LTQTTAAPGTESQAHRNAAATDFTAERGVVPWQGLRAAVDAEWIQSGDFRVLPDAYQPASLDLHLGEKAWALRCSFLPGSESAVRDRASELTLQEVDLRDGAMLERDRPYLIQLREELRLPEQLRGKANPKSSTGRLDVFTRLITDHNNRFDEVARGYEGNLYLEVVPRSFAIYVREGLALNQLRLMNGDARVSDGDLRSLHGESPLVYHGAEPVADSRLQIAGGLFLSLDLEDRGDGRVVGYRAKKNSHPVDLAKVRHYRWHDYWEPVVPEQGSRIVLEPETFYLLLSAEGVSIPPRVAAEMAAYDPTAGELRTHYAGFFDPGFGFSRHGERGGSRAALEVRARDVPFMVEHGQPVCKLAFELMAEEPEVLYGDDLDSNYQGQVSMLSKHFEEQTAGVSRPA
jgi:dCTP deaminase